MKTIGEFFKQVREKNGMSQAEVAKKAGVSGAQLSRIESGKSGMSTMLISNLADVFDLNPIPLIKEAGFKRDIVEACIDERIERFYDSKAYNNLSNNNIDFMLKFIELYMNSNSEEREIIIQFVSKFKLLSEKERRLFNTILS